MEARPAGWPRARQGHAGLLRDWGVPLFRVYEVCASRDVCVEQSKRVRKVGCSLGEQLRMDAPTQSLSRIALAWRRELASAHIDPTK